MPSYDPKLTILQIVALQCFYYVLMGAVLASFKVIFGTQISVNLIFSSQISSFSIGPGLTSAFATFISSILGSMLLVIIVEKSKRCLDFTATLYILHFLFAYRFEGFPTRWEWYTMQCVSFMIMVLLGECLCARSEMRDIPLYTPLTVTNGHSRAPSRTLNIEMSQLQMRNKNAQPIADRIAVV